MQTFYGQIKYLVILLLVRVIGLVPNVPSHCCVNMSPGCFKIANELLNQQYCIKIISFNVRLEILCGISKVSLGFHTKYLTIH